MEKLYALEKEIKSFCDELEIDDCELRVETATKTLIVKNSHRLFYIQPCIRPGESEQFLFNWRHWKSNIKWGEAWEPANEVIKTVLILISADKARDQLDEALLKHKIF